jgi:hypothetical protein
MGGNPGPKENSDVESSAKTDNLPGQRFVLKTLVLRCVRSQENKARCPGAGSPSGVLPLVMLPNDQINPIFRATVQATEEAVVNAIVAAETMTGVKGHAVIALPHDRLREHLKKYNRHAH